MRRSLRVSLWTSRMRRRSAAMLCSIFSSSVCGASGFSLTWARAMDGVGALCGAAPLRHPKPSAEELGKLLPAWPGCAVAGGAGGKRGGRAIAAASEAGALRAIAPAPQRVPKTTVDTGATPVPAAEAGSLLAGRGGSLSSAYLGAGGSLGHEGGVSLADAAVLPAAQVLVAHLDAHLAGGTAQGLLSRGGERLGGEHACTAPPTRGRGVAEAPTGVPHPKYPPMEGWGSLHLKQGVKHRGFQDVWDPEAGQGGGGAVWWPSISGCLSKSCVG